MQKGGRNIATVSYETEWKKHGIERSHFLCPFSIHWKIKGNLTTQN